MEIAKSPSFLSLARSAKSRASLTASSLVMPLMAAEAVLVTSGKACVRTSSRSGSVFLAMAFAMFLSVCATRKIGLPVV